jgi:xanthosine utilization system XapX-like protein
MKALEVFVFFVILGVIVLAVGFAGVFLTSYKNPAWWVLAFVGIILVLIGFAVYPGTKSRE